MRHMICLALACFSTCLVAREKSPALRTMLIYESDGYERKVALADVKRVSKFFQRVANETGLRFVKKIVDNTRFTKETFTSWLKTTKKTTNDVVVVYYSGSGTESTIPSSIWPAINCAKSLKIEEGDLADLVKKNSPSFALIVFDCYNNFICEKNGIFTIKLREVNFEPHKKYPGLKTLFRKNTGLIMTASGRSGFGYYIGAPHQGGVFTKSLLSNICIHTKTKFSEWSRLWISVDSTMQFVGMRPPIFEGNYKNRSRYPHFKGSR